jgi:carbamate kinase
MGPKVESACRFVERTGKRAAIGAVADAAALCAGEAGTQIVTLERLGDSRISGVPGVSAR